jgi:hypothetical protein
MKWILPVIVSIAGAAMLSQLPWRGIDPDELEHVHAACAVSWGEVPYRDFFEHHGPALYYLLQPIVRLTGPELPALWWSRLLMWSAGMATLAMTAAIAYRLSGKTAAAVAPALLACTTIFFQKAIEVRPDVPAMLLLTLAAYVAIATGNRRSTPVTILVGFLLGLATLFTQKAIVPAAALILTEAVADIGVPLLGTSSAGQPKFHGHCLFQAVAQGGWKCLLAIVAAGAVWLAAAGLFWTIGGVVAFLHATIVQLWLWPVRFSPLPTLRPTLMSDMPLWIGAAAAVVAAIRTLGQWMRGPQPGRPLLNREVTILSLTVLICFAGALLIKAAYAQYYLLWFPLAAVVTADELVRWATGEMTFRIRRWFFCVLAALVVVEAALAVQSIYKGANGPLPHLTGRLSTLNVGLLAGGILAALAAAAGVCIVRGRRAGAILSLAALSLGYAGLRNLDALCWSNRSQTAAIARVCRLVGPDETVLDGYTGLGAFRRHAYYYWWLNPYSLSLMPPAARNQDLLASLKRSPPKLICADANIRLLPPEVLAWIEQHYTPLERPLYIRKR